MPSSCVLRDENQETLGTLALRMLGTSLRSFTRACRGLLALAVLFSPAWRQVRGSDVQTRLGIPSWRCFYTVRCSVAGGGDGLSCCWCGVLGSELFDVVAEPSFLVVVLRVIASFGSRWEAHVV